MTTNNLHSYQATYLVLSIVIALTLIYATVFYVLFFNFFRRKIYTKLKAKFAMWIPLYVYDLLILITAILLTIIFKINVYFILIWIEIGLAILLTFVLLISFTSVNRNKKQIMNFRQEDFQQMLMQLEKTKPNAKFIEKYLMKHKFYISQLEQQKKIIDSMMEHYQQQDYEQVLLNIILFNDRFTSRWSNKSNYFQMKFFLEFCINLQKKEKK